jgi:hypothetical protein
VDSRRVASNVLAVTGAVLMAASPFPDWYHLDTGDSRFQLSGWDVFEIVDVLLVGAAVATLVIVARGSRLPAVGASLSLLVLGIAMAAIVAIQLIDKPPLIAFGGFAISLQIGAWIALTGALLVLVAGAVIPRSQPAR